MLNVLVEKNKLDVLATAISNKSGEPLTLTLDEMVEAVDGIETDSGGITPTGNINITHAGQTDVTNYATATVPEGILKMSELLEPTPYISINSNGLITADVNESLSSFPVESSGWLGAEENAMTIYVGGTNSYQLPTQGATTITPTTSQQTAVTAGKYTTGAVTVSAMPSGTAGTPTATKGTVSNHSVSVTPSVTNTTGYITGGTKSGTAVTVSASELVSGSETKTANGTYDVTNLASLVVALEFSTIYTGSSNPSSSTGTNGDIYLKI